MCLLPKKSAVCSASKDRLKFTVPLILIKCLYSYLFNCLVKNLMERGYFGDLVADGRRILSCKCKEISDSRWARSFYRPQNLFTQKLLTSVTIQIEHRVLLDIKYCQIITLLVLDLSLFPAHHTGALLPELFHKYQFTAFVTSRSNCKNCSAVLCSLHFSLLCEVPVIWECVCQ
jgi:hypothetical protein